MERISAKGSLPPRGHYSPAILDGELLYISGQLPINPFTGAHCGGDIGEQAKQVFENLDEILRAAGIKKDQVIKVVAYISDVNDWEEVDKACQEYFGGHYPVRSIVPVGPLHYGFKLELEGIARVAGQRRDV